MDPRQLLEENVALVDRLAARACRRVGIAPDQAGDVASMVKVQLMENDYAILRRWEGRSSLATYLTIVVQRLLADQHERTHGRWRPSPEAQRLGETAVLIEDLVSRQGRSIDESLPLVRAADASMTHEQVAAIADRLPRRAPRPREVELPLAGEVPLPAADRTDGRALDGELRQTAARAGALLRETMEGWAAEDRLLVRLRFESSLSIADIARVLNTGQRPLYRRLEALLRRLREALLLAGIDEAAADDLVSAGSRIDVDLGLAWKNDGSRRTTEASGRASPEERS